MELFGDLIRRRLQVSFFFSLFVCLFEFGIYFLNWDYMLFFLFFFWERKILLSYDALF